VQKCAEYIRLEAAVSAVLLRLANVATMQAEMFRSGNDSEFVRLDKETELIVGEKERAIGALRQHSKEHRCWAFRQRRIV
jgi:hypothetical protein